MTSCAATREQLLKTLLPRSPSRYGTREFLLGKLSALLCVLSWSGVSYRFYMGWHICTEWVKRGARAKCTVT